MPAERDTIIRGIEDENQDLRTQLAQCQERLARAEELLTKITKKPLRKIAALNQAQPSYMGIVLTPFDIQDIQTFLSTATPSDLVVVRREDLKWLLPYFTGSAEHTFYDKYGFSKDHIDRLKATLEKKP